jgi:hypothetical protein
MGLGTRLKRKKESQNLNKGLSTLHKKILFQPEASERAATGRRLQG